MIESPWFHSLLFESEAWEVQLVYGCPLLWTVMEKEKNNFMFVVILKVSSQEEFFHCG